MQCPQRTQTQIPKIPAFLVASTEGQTNPYAQCLKEELDLLSKHSDAYLFHDHLEENNHPMFFYQFMELAKENGLQFMSETNLSGMITSNLPPKAAEALTKLTNDVHHRSQYTDFVTNRMFRQSLLCRSNQLINRHLDESRFEEARFVGKFQIEPSNGTMDLSPTVEVTFKCPNGRTIRTSNAPLKAMMYEMSAAFPASLSLAEISAKVEMRLSQTLVVGEQDQVRKFCASNLVQLIVRGDIEFRIPKDRFTISVEERPRISGLSRLQARAGGNVTTQLHGMIAPDPMTRLVMQILDGTRNRQQLSEFIADLVSSGKIKVNVQGEQKVEMATVYDATVEKILEQMRRHGLLVRSSTERNC
ncbi:MAG TPA: methyltransferase regulatory domain-containing protein [Pirellula sp.]|nr:methyltransferase regulatory domain-containing protein [Pirellula sp.]